MKPSERIVIIGGVAAGASFAARARRLSESAQITIIEKGPDVSFANCGLPYFIGGEITDRDSLAVQTPKSLKVMLNLDTRTLTEAISIDTEAQTVEVLSLEDRTQETLPYDILMLAPGANPIVPPIPGIADKRIHTLRNLQDMDRIKAAVAKAQEAVVVGAGFIGLEMAEQLHRLGLHVTIVEKMPQVLPQLDREMALLMESELKEKGLDVVLDNGILGFQPRDCCLVCELEDGQSIEADLVVMSIGVKPDTTLASNAGIKLGARGHMLVDEFQQVSAKNVYAAGDAVETLERITQTPTAVPLGGPANRQGRVAADHVFLGKKARAYPGSLGTAIVRVFDVASGLTGWTQRRLEATDKEYEATIVNDNHHAAYYPGARPMILKVLWEKGSGKLLGAQVTGFEGVDKRLDVLATAITAGMTIEDLCHLELAYAPPFGSAKDIINVAGFAGTNAMDGLVKPTFELPDPNLVQVVDVRPKVLCDAHPYEGSINIPFPTLRSNLEKLDPSKPVVTICAFGKMSYFAARVLQQHGYDVTCLVGGIRAHLDPRTPAKPPPVK